MQTFTLQNTLSAPVEIVLRCSNPERLEVNPKQMKLAPRELCEVECTFRQMKPFPPKCAKQGEMIFIKSDFFDQKISVTVTPSFGTSALVQTGVAFGVRPQQQTTMSSKVARRADDSRDLMELAGESFGKGSQHGLCSPPQFLRPDLTAGSHEEDMRAINSDFERDSAQGNVNHTNAGDVDELRSIISDLKQENAQLKQLLIDAQHDLSNTGQHDLSQLNRIRDLLREREPKLDELLLEAMRYERANQEKKDRKVLEILQFKDAQIDDLTERLSNAEQQMNQLKAKYEQKMRETQDLLDKMNEKMNLFENEEKFQELLKSQELATNQKERINQLEQDLNQSKLQLSEQENREVYYSDAYKACKRQLDEKERSLQHLQEMHASEKHRSEALSAQVIELKAQLSILNESLTGKKSERADPGVDQKYKLLLEAAELERDGLMRQVAQMKDLMVGVHQILGRVTGEDVSQLTGAESQSSFSKSVIATDIEHRLELRAEEIVKIVEQVQSNYFGLEQEMRALVEMKSDKSTIVAKTSQKRQYDSKISHETQIVQTMESKIHSNESHAHSQNNDGQEEDSKHSTGRLNQKIFELKDRERQLLEQLTFLKEQLRFQTSKSISQHTLDQDKYSQDHNAQRIAELETLIFQQREQILSQQDEIVNLRQNREDEDCDMKNQIEMLSLRNRNLQELNKKYEVSDVFKSHRMNSPAMKSTAVETERIRQQNQHLEFANIDLRHKLEEMVTAKVQAVKELEVMRAKQQMMEREITLMQQEALIRRAGLNPADSKMVNLVQELRNRIKQLEGQRSETTTNYMHSGRLAQSESNFTLHTQNNLQSKTLFALKEEYCTKLEKLVDQNAAERSHLQTQVSNVTAKNEGITKQLKIMEEKDFKWFTQVEELKLQSESEREIYQARLKDLERVLQQKNQLSFEMEREVKKKETMLSERQEQLSILLSAMEQQSHSVDDPMQKVANLAAELCSMKAIEAQHERRANDLVHSERQAQLEISRLKDEVLACQQNSSRLQRSISTLESSKELLERQKYDLTNQYEEVKRDQSEAKYRLERMQFQLKVKEETIEQMKTQLKGSEHYFREQIDRIREESIAMSKRVQTQDSRPRREGTLKQEILKLHLVIADYIERTCDEDGESRAEVAKTRIIGEMEKSLQVAAETLSKLESDLDRERHKVQQLENEWDAQVLNNILVMRQERLVAQLRTLNQLIDDRENEASKVLKLQSEANHRVVRELEQKAEAATKLLAQADDNATQLAQKVNTLMLEKDDLQNSVLCFQQELANQKSAMELKAQLTVDERFKAKNQSIVNYYENQISKAIGVQVPDGQKLIALGRENCSLQLIVDKQTKQIEQLTTAVQSQELNVRFYREKLAEQEQKTRDGAHHMVQATQAHKTAMMSVKIELERKKQDILAVEKELILNREAAEHKARENISLIQRIENIKAGEMYDREMKYLRDRVDGAEMHVSADYERQSKKIQSLQEQLMDLRGSHIQEIDDLRQRAELEVAEAKRELSLRKQELEKKFAPGVSPGELIDQNEELRLINNQLSDELEQAARDRDAMQKQLDELLYQVEFSREDTHGYRQALQELETALLNPQPPERATKSLKKSQKPADKEAPLEVSHLRTVDRFTKNPPLLIKELIKAKSAEHMAKMKLREHLVVESKLRQQLAAKIKSDAATEQMEDVVNQLIAQNDNIIQLLNTNGYDSAPIDANEPQLLCSEDSTLLVNTIIALIDQLTSSNKELPGPRSMLEKIPSAAVIEGQRIVIRALSAKKDGFKINYMPERELDRKIWYLELLEQQVQEAEKSTQALQDFVKRLQIGVSGNLHSAAEIKATSMDLAQNLKGASDEVKALRHIATLIKHDVLQQQTSDADHYKTQNPFAESDQQTARSFQQTNRLQDTQRSLDKLMHENESMHNQLSLTSKIKQSIEQELVNAKLQHATELQGLITKFARAERSLHQAQDENKLLKERVAKVELDYEQKVDSYLQLEAELKKKEDSIDKAKNEATKSKEASKNLQKLQSDMQEWRKQSEANLKLKTEQLKSCQDQLSAVSFEKEKLKVEVSMLRKAQKAIREGAELTRVEEENRQLAQKLEVQLDERKQEIDFWVAERAQMRERIELLESKTVNVHEPSGNNQEVVEELKSKVRKAAKLIKSKDYETQALQGELVSAKDSFAKAQLEILTCEQKLREESQRVTDALERLQLAQKRQRELEIERDLLSSKARQQAAQTDNAAAQVGQEVDSLRSEFAKLKFEKESLVNQVEVQSRREQEFTQTVERLTSQVQSLQSGSMVKINEHENQSKTLEQKNTALLADLKYLRLENEKLQARLKEAQQQVLAGDQQYGQVTQQMQVQVQLIEEVKRKIIDAETALKTKSLRINELEGELVHVESQTYAKTKALQESLSKLRAEAMQTQAIFTSQITTLKQRISEKGTAGQKTGKDIELTLQLAQKDTINKQLKKEVGQLKQQATKLKSKNASLKEQLESITQKPTQPVEQRGKKQPPEAKPVGTQNAFETHLIDKLASLGGLQNMLQALRHVNKLEASLTESDQSIVKLENWNAVLTQQIEELQGQHEDREELIVEMKQQQKEIKKDIQNTAAATEKMLRDQLRQAQKELEQTKNEWLSPQAVKEQVELVASLQQQLKQLQSEVARKGKLVSQLKTQKEAQDEETSAFIASMNELKDDYARQQKLIKEFHKRDSQAKDLRSQIEWLQKQERTAKEEVISLNEKLKTAKTEISRKDQVIREYRDKLECMQDGQKATKDMNAEIDKLREIQRKHKLEVEIKENQIRVLKQRLETNQEELQGLSLAKEGMLSHGSQLDSKLRQIKAKSKRYEEVLACALATLRHIVVNIVQHASSSPQKTLTPQIHKREDSMKTSDVHTDAAYYKESVEILGLGLSDLEDFINPHKAIKPFGQTQASKMADRKSVSREDQRYDLLEKLDRVEYMFQQKCISCIEMQRELEDIMDACTKLIKEWQTLPITQSAVKV